MNYLITIKQPYADYMLEGKKFYVIRKRIPKNLTTGDMIFFCIKGDGNRISGKFDVGKISLHSVFAAAKYYSDETKVSHDDTIKYMRKSKNESIPEIYNKHIYFIEIKNVISIHPIHVSILGLKSAPQNFVKINISKIIDHANLRKSLCCR